jgi:hypothetical protein
MVGLVVLAMFLTALVVIFGIYYKGNAELRKRVTVAEYRVAIANEYLARIQFNPAHAHTYAVDAISEINTAEKQIEQNKKK